MMNELAAEPMNGMTSGHFPAQEAPDRSAFGLAIQRDQLNAKATGQALGRGRRMAPSPDATFSQPLSGAQFGGGGMGQAKATFGGQ